MADTPVYIRFETGQENRISQEYGPFPFVQMTYGSLRVGPDGEDFAYFNKVDEDWHLEPRFGPTAPCWSDIIIYSAPCTCET